MAIRFQIPGAVKSAFKRTFSGKLKQFSLFLSLLLIVPLIAFSIVQLNGPSVRQNAFDNLDSIAKLKADGIANWLAERQVDLEFLAADNGFTKHAERLVLTGNAEAREVVTRRLQVYSRSKPYHSAFLMDSSGRVVVATGEQVETDDAVTRQVYQAAMKNRQITLGDLHVDGRSGHIYIDMVLPLQSDGSRPPVAAVLFHIVAKDFLFSFIQSWPTPSHSAESMLVRRDGNEVLFLNELRHRRGAALTLRMPIEMQQLPAAATVLSGKPLTMEGVDYRGVPVFAASRPVAGMPWFLVAKMDSEEVLAPLKELIFWVSLLALVTALIIAGAIWRLWRQAQHNQQMELAARAVELQREGEAKYRRLYESMMDAYVMLDMSGHLIDFNPSYRDMLGYTGEELRGLSYQSLSPEQWRDMEARIIEGQVMSGGQSQVYEKECIRKGGTHFPVELRAFLLRDKDGQPEAIWAIVRDISERKQNENILRATEDLTRSVMDSLQNSIAVLDQEGTIIRVNQHWRDFAAANAASNLVSQGVGLNYFDVCRRATADGEAWAEPALAGMMQILRGERSYFSIEYPCHSPSEQRWFMMEATPLTGSLSGVVVNHIDITQRKKAENELRIAATAFESYVGITVTDAKHHILQVNHAFTSITGYPAEEVVGKNPKVLRSGRHDASFYREMWGCINCNGVWEGEIWNRRKNGEIYPEYRTISAVRDAQGNVTNYVAIFSDITEKKLAEEELQAYFDLIPELVCVASPDGRLLKINKIWQEVLGYTEAEILATPYLEMIHPDDREATMREVGRQMAGSVTRHFANRYRCKDGSYRWLEWGAAPSLDGRLLFAAARDVTEQKKLVEELERHRNHLEGLVQERTRELAELVETLKMREAALEQQQRFLKTVTNARPDMVGYWNSELRCGFANAAYQSWFGKRPEEIIGMRMQDLLGEDVFRKNESHIRAALRGEPQSFERTLVKADGSTGYAWAHYIPDTVDGRTQGFFVLVSDVTELKSIQFKLEQTNAALKESTLEAEAANRAKSAFLANMSHELRTPLNVIIGFSDILRRSSGLSETQQQNLALIHKSGDHLLGLINDVLDIAKIEAGGVKLELAPFDFGAMINDIADMLRLRAEEKRLQLRVDQSSGFPRYIVADAAKLRQVLINLISNAIKATAQGGVILHLGLKHNHAEHLLIEVEDSGCGIAPEDQARILEPFVQVGAPARQQGTGLGLAITRQFVDMMGGQLSFVSTVGQGSIFRVDVPVQVAQTEDIPQPPQARGAVTALAPGKVPSRVLVVEDEPIQQMLLEGMLECVGFMVECAENGAEAVEKFQSWRPDFIWMDRRMPVMDGEEATRRIRTLPQGDKVKIAAVTTSTFREENEAMRAAGFDAIVHKPYRREQIYDCMEQLLGLHFMRAEVVGGAKPLPELSPEAMAAVPESLCRDLEEALVILDRERILAIMDEIAQFDPVLGANLREWTHGYNYTPVLELLQARNIN